MKQEEFSERVKLIPLGPEMLAALKLWEASVQACPDPEFWSHLREAREVTRAILKRLEGK